MNYLNVEKLSVCREGKFLVEDASLSIAAGEIVGLIGPNGAGKSTLVKAIQNLIKKDSGTIEILGENMERKSERERAKELAYLPQHQEAYWPLTVRNVVELGRFPHKQPWQSFSGKEGREIDKILEELDIGHLAERRVDRLSGGERSLSLLARAIAVDAAILLADEPVADLDPNHQLQIMNLLAGYAKVRERSVLVVLHDLTLAARYCDRLYLMHRGKMMKAGEPKEVLTDKYLRASYGIEAKTGEIDDRLYVIPWRRL